MNKYLIITLFAILFCKCLIAQPPGVSGFRLYDRDYRVSIGPKGGVGLATGTASQLYDFTVKSGMSFQGGLAVNAHFGKRTRFGFGNGGTGWFGAQAEVLYSRRSLKWGNTAVNMNCIEIPLLAQVYPLAEVGIEAGLTMVKVLGFTPDLLQVSTAYMHTGQIKAGDVMLTMGVSYKAPFGLLIDARYNMGFSALAGNVDSKVSSVMVSVGYLIDIVK